MRRFRRLAPVLATAACLLVAAASVLAYVTATPAADAARLREEAQRRWQQRDFARYKLAIDDGGGCVRVMAVAGTRVEETLRGGACLINPMSVDDLFALLSRFPFDRPRVVQYHTPTGCTYTERVGWEASYDPVLGFPRTLVLRVRNDPPWARIENWMYALRYGRLPSCPRTGFELGTIQVESVTPLK